MRPIDLLRQARELLADPKRWTQGTGARAGDGLATGVHSANAICWCAWGALVYVHTDLNSLSDSLDLIATIVGESEVSSWNDAPERTHEEVLAAFDRAIELAGET